MWINWDIIKVIKDRFHVITSGRTNIIIDEQFRTIEDEIFNILGLVSFLDGFRFLIIFIVRDLNKRNLVNTHEPTWFERFPTFKSMSVFLDECHPYFPNKFDK